MSRSILIAGFLGLLAVAAHAGPEETSGKPAPLRTVTHVDLERYTGTWYEIASYPQRFQKGCTATTAIYTHVSFEALRTVARPWPTTGGER